MRLIGCADARTLTEIPVRHQIDRINDAVGRCVAPLIVVFIFLNRYFIQGLVGSGVKG